MSTILKNQNNYFYCFILIGTLLFTMISSSLIAQKKINILKPSDIIEIYSLKTGRSIYRNELRNKDSIYSKFGKPDSIKTDDVTALGGDVTFLFFGDNYFYVSTNQYASDGFKICNNSFYVVINDTLEIKVGSKIHDLVEIIDSKRHRPKSTIMGSEIEVKSKFVGEFYLPYGYWYNDELREAGHWLVIYYDLESQQIIGILDFHRS